MFLSNTATGFGGGAFVNDATTLNGGLFQNNHSTSSFGIGGGGLFSFSTLALTGTQFIGNSGTNGGGLYASDGGRFVNALFARNTASSTLGSAIFVNSGSVQSVQILHTTITSPTVGSGSAIYNAAGIIGITDTIISRYSIGINNVGGTVYEDYNLFFGNPISRTGTIGGANDVVGDPKFVNPAADNYHLQPGSAAINHGIDAGVTTDIDGQARPLNGLFDIGFDELQIYSIYLPLVLKHS